MLGQEECLLLCLFYHLCFGNKNSFFLIFFSPMFWQKESFLLCLFSHLCFGKKNVFFLVYFLTYVLARSASLFLFHCHLHADHKSGCMLPSCVENMIISIFISNKKVKVNTIVIVIIYKTHYLLNNIHAVGIALTKYFILPFFIFLIVRDLKI